MEDQPAARTPSTMTIVALTMGAAFAGFLLADYKQWRTGANDGGMNIWGTIKVSFLGLNILAWLAVTGMLFFKKQSEHRYETAYATVLIGVWMVNGFCLGGFLVGLIFFLLPRPG
jgi:hypothetical protein